MTCDQRPSSTAARRAWATCAAGATCIGLLAGGLPSAARGQPLVLEDAERFAALLQAPGLPDEARLQARYIEPGTPGIRLFTPHRIRDAATLARALASNPAAYRLAAQHCLPAARRMQGELSQIAARIGTLLGQAQPAPAWVVFGAGNSGGTASAEGLVLGLEVICRQARSEAAAAQVLRDFMAHELVHVHQARRAAPPASDSLLRQVLVEGLADHLMRAATDGRAVSDGERDRYGQAHEAQLWREFKAAVDAGRGWQGWMYGPSTVPGRPADMGYWLGRRICDAYVARAADPVAARQVLLVLQDPEAILRDSGYGQGLAP